LLGWGRARCARCATDCTEAPPACLPACPPAACVASPTAAPSCKNGDQGGSIGGALLPSDKTYASMQLDKDLLRLLPATALYARLAACHAELRNGGQGKSIAGVQLPSDKTCASTQLDKDPSRLLPAAAPRARPAACRDCARRSLPAHAAMPPPRCAAKRRQGRCNGGQEGSGTRRTEHLRLSPRVCRDCHGPALARLAARRTRARTRRCAAVHRALRFPPRAAVPLAAARVARPHNGRSCALYCGWLGGGCLGGSGRCSSRELLLSISARPSH
jgi:hypothetical protein